MLSAFARLSISATMQGRDSPRPFSVVIVKSISGYESLDRSGGCYTYQRLLGFVEENVLQIVVPRLAFGEFFWNPAPGNQDGTWRKIGNTSTAKPTGVVLLMASKAAYGSTMRSSSSSTISVP